MKTWVQMKKLSIGVILACLALVSATIMKANERSAVVPSVQDLARHAARSIPTLESGFNEALKRAGPHRGFFSLGYFETIGFTANYCFEYFDESNPEIYKQIDSLLSGYSGRLRWSLKPEFNNKGSCISYIPDTQIRAAFSGEEFTFVPFDEIAEDALKLCAYLGDRLKSLLQQQPSIRSDTANLNDPNDEGIYEIYVLANL